MSLLISVALELHFSQGKHILVHDVFRSGSIESCCRGVIIQAVTTACQVKPLSSSPSVIYGWPGLCQYSLLKQPHSLTDCNPWPRIAMNGSTLSLHCIVLGPQTDDEFPSVIWFRGEKGEGKNATRIYFDSMKYSSPIYSRDVGSGLRQADFTLRVASVAMSDAGCYWCRVSVLSQRCTSTLLNSTAFCLLPEAAYPSSLGTCADLSHNSTSTCVGNNSCIEGAGSNPSASHTPSTAGNVGVASGGASGIIAVAVLKTHSAKIHSLSRTTPPSFAQDTPSATTKLTSVTVTPAVTMAASPPVSSSHIPSTGGRSSPSSPPSPSTLHPSPSTPARLTSTLEPSAAVRVGLYMGVAVCVLLLAVTAILAMAIVVLLSCRTTPPQTTPTRTSTDSAALAASDSSSIRHEATPSEQTRVRAGPRRREEMAQGMARGHYYYVLEGPRQEPVCSGVGPEGVWSEGEGEGPHHRAEN